LSPPPIKFTKMSAGGNDFLVIDNVTATGTDAVAVTPDLIRRVCARALSVGGDGVIVLEPSEGASVKMVYYNADGGRARLCGNGVRCVARLAALKRFAPAEEMTIESDAGTLPAGVQEDRAWFRLSLGRPAVETRSVELPGSLDEVSRVFDATLVTAGVPHLVVETPDAHGLSREAFLRLAPRLRGHPDFAPHGVNVDFVTIRDEHTIDIRCYERGVEAETLSSGTGCIASAIALVHAGRGRSPLICRSRAGLSSQVTLTEAADGSVQATLSGDARVIFTGVLHEEALTGFAS